MGSRARAHHLEEWYGQSHAFGLWCYAWTCSSMLIHSEINIQYTVFLGMSLIFASTSAFALSEPAAWNHQRGSTWCHWLTVHVLPVSDSVDPENNNINPQSFAVSSGRRLYIELAYADQYLSWLLLYRCIKLLARSKGTYISNLQISFRKQLDNTQYSHHEILILGHIISFSLGQPLLGSGCHKYNGNVSIKSEILFLWICHSYASKYPVRIPSQLHAGML